MKLKISELYDLSVGLDELAQKDIPISLSLKVKRSIKAVKEELISPDQIRQEITDKYKDKDLGGGRSQIKEGKEEEFMSEINELMWQEVEVDIPKIDIKDLENVKMNGEEISIKPKTLMQLESILNAD